MIAKLFWILIFTTPIWMPVLLWWLSPAAMKKFLIFLCVLWVGTGILALFDASNREPWKWPSVMVWLAITWVLFGMMIGRTVAAFRERRRAAQRTRLARG